MLQKNKIK